MTRQFNLNYCRGKIYYKFARKLLFLCICMLLPLALKAARTPQTISPKIDLSSPYATVQTHFILLSPGNKFLKNTAALFMCREAYPGESKEIAVKLKKILTLQSVNVETISQNPNHIDPVVNEHRYILYKKLPLIYLVKHGEEWRYSEETFIFISQYQEAFKLNRLFYHCLPKEFCKKKILDLAIWQYIVLIVLVISIWLIHKIMPYVFKYVFHRFIKGSQRKQFTIERLLFILVAISFLKLVFPMLQLATLATFMDRVLGATISFLLMYLSYECVGVVQEQIKISNRHSQFMMHILPVYSMLVKIVIILYGLIKTIDNFGIETGSLVQVLSFSTIGLGLAAQDTIKNLFGSLMIIMNRPFNIGDEIASDTIRGKVEDIGLRATLLRTKEGSLVYIPNAKLADTAIDNFGRRNSRMVCLEIPLSYDIPLDVLPKFVKGLRVITRRQPFIMSEKTELHLDKMSEDGFVVILKLYLDNSEGAIERKCKHSVIALILQMAHHLEIRLGQVKNIYRMKEPIVEDLSYTKSEIEKLFEEPHKEEEE